MGMCECCEQFCFCFALFYFFKYFSIFFILLFRIFCFWLLSIVSVFGFLQINEMLCSRSSVFIFLLHSHYAIMNFVEKSYVLVYCDWCHDAAKINGMRQCNSQLHNENLFMPINYINANARNLSCHKRFTVIRLFSVNICNFT